MVQSHIVAAAHSHWLSACLLSILKLNLHSAMAPVGLLSRACKCTDRLHEPHTTLCQTCTDAEGTLQAHSPMVQLQFMASITRVLGPETWFNCVSLLTHGCTAPPDSPQGAPMDYHRALEMRKRDLSMQLRQALPLQL